MVTLLIVLQIWCLSKVRTRRAGRKVILGFFFIVFIKTGAPNDNFPKNICSEDDLRSRIFETFVVKFLACLPLLGFSNILKMV